MHYFKVNFSSLIKIVDAIGGVEVDSPYTFSTYDNKYTFHKGKNKLNGEKGFIPISPRKKEVKDWTTKGMFMIATTAAESIVIGTLIINFDFITFLSCISSSITAIIFGLVQMVKDEVYWTDEYLLYAEYITKNINEELPEKQEKSIKISTETDFLESGEELSQEEKKGVENA